MREREAWGGGGEYAEFGGECVGCDAGIVGDYADNEDVTRPGVAEGFGGRGVELGAAV